MDKEDEQANYSSLVKQADESLKLHLRMSSMKIDRSIHHIENEQGELVPVRLDRLNAATSFGICCPSSSSSASLVARWGDRAIWLTFCTLNVYTCVKFAYLCSVHLEHDRLVDRMRNFELESPNSTIDDAYCRQTFLLANESRLVGSDNFKILTELSDELDRLGSPVRTPIGYNIVGFIYAALSVFCVSLGVAWLGANRPQLSLLNFVADIRAERVKYRLKLTNLVRALFKIEKTQLIDGRWRFVYVQQKNSTTQQAPIRGFNRRCYEISSSIRNQSRIELDERLEDMLGPAHLRDWWHKRLCKSLTLFPILRIMLVAPVSSAFFICPLFELIDLANMRLEAVRCQVAIENNYQTELSGLRMKALESTADLQLYRNFDGSLFEMLALLWIEAKLIITWRFLVTVCEVSFAYTVAAFGIPVFWLMYAYNYTTMMLWLLQIERQLDDCLQKLIEDGVELALKPNSSRLETRERRNRSLKRITLAYLNFELFRREQEAYQRLANFLVFLGTIFNILSLIVHYYLFGTARRASDANSTMTLASYVASFTNLYFISCAIRAGKMLRLMKNVCRLAAFSVDSSLRLSPIVNLWTAQLINQSETERCYSPRLLGVSLSFDNIIAFNIYWAILWFVIRRD